MCESYARSLLRVSVAQICQALGWDAVQLTACDLLSDVLNRYIQQLARVCHRYSELCKCFVCLPDYFLNPQTSSRRSRCCWLGLNWRPLGKVDVSKSRVTRVKQRPCIVISVVDALQLWKTHVFMLVSNVSCVRFHSTSLKPVELYFWLALMSTSVSVTTT